MADPLRRTILAKLRGKKAKGKDASSAHHRPREGKEKVSLKHAAREFMRGKERGVYGTRTADPVAALGRAAADVRASGRPAPGGPAGVSDQSEATEMKRVHTQRVRGDSIGFGSCERVPLNAKRDALEVTDGPDLRSKATNVASREQQAGVARQQPSRTPHVFDYIDEKHDLIQVLESSLQYHGDFRMPALQSPTFFPTELEINVTPGAPRHHSVHSEDDDYYDNQILPFYTQNQGTINRISVVEPPAVQTLELGASETDRLKTQLKEAYYLLINTMHDIPFEGPVEDNGFVDQVSSSSESHESVSSRSTPKHTGSDACLSDERGGAQGFGSDSALLTRSGRCRVEFKGSLPTISTARVKHTLQRSLSDRGVKYSSEWPSNSKSRSAAGDVPLRCCEGPVHNVSKESVSGSVVPSEILLVPGTHQSGDAGVVARHPGVTVNKMQEWMLKGRMLSSEMKERIAGSSLRASSGQMRLKARAHVSVSRNASTGAQQQSAMDCMAGSSGVSRRDPCTRQPPLNHITVSKKRNWLQQSSARPILHPEDFTSPPAAEEDLTAPQTHPFSDASSRLRRPNVKPSQTSPHPPRRPDPAEENDADDEGEIWYNPIPEDEEADLPRCIPKIRVGRTEPSPGASGRRATGESVGGEGGCRETPHASASHSSETSQLHRQMFACKTQEENISVRATEASEPSAGGPSPTSSPNPAKRSTAINWSFPDKIKSPRTVRKLSMKMKKLPDLSRKLSVKGNPSNHGPSETGVQSRATRVELGSSPPRLATALASGNVIWHYHLDSSVSTQHNFDKRRSNSGGVPKSASKGGYLSDGDSPELVAKSGKHGTSDRKNGKTRDPNGNAGKLPGTELDIDAFRSYSFSEQPKCLSYISGLMSLHFYGAEDLKPPRLDSRDVYCAIQVDSVNKARTALLTCRTAFLDMDHTFNIDLENAQHLKLVVFSWESTARRNRVCCHGSVVLPAMFRVRKTHQLAVRLEPRGMIYVKLSLMQQRLNSQDGDHQPQVFGVDARRVVEREASGLVVPLLIEKCIAEIERRGCQVVGLYRLCGSAAVKKELREAFERDSLAVELSENNYPDINVITGVLKDYLRELPHPLISQQLYESVLESMSRRPLQIGAGGCENDPADSEHTVSLLEVLPEVEKATLRKLMDHLKRVASHHEMNKMTCQNLAVCFGPVLLSQRQDASSHGNRVFIDSEELASALHFKKHIEVLHYLLQLWPVVDTQGNPSSPAPTPVESFPKAAVRRRKDRPQVLNLSEAEVTGALRPRAGRLDSPSNRYAGDWSGCREPYLQPSCPDDADYTDVPNEDPPDVAQEDLPKLPGDTVLEEDSPEVGEGMERDERMQVEKEDSEGDDWVSFQREECLPISPCHQILQDLEEHRPKEHTYQAFMKIQEISPVLTNRVNLRDLQESIDALIGNLERELNKNKLNMRY
ncbi:rho GTPase-activating protein SYDE2 isoform X2 [Triplophysa rosa]|uniref:rho GTPase-activating protein SYDE2 isoform X2 n=1 Tax=Triplophysa rosa TaxID=992332 RepID=UPI002545E71B|nr:rho GTPase-activating protein SYDE2 isoform X2 [Triplophysa rosa]